MKHAGQFVWLELSYDKPENQAFITRHQADAFPVFYVIDPRTEKVLATWLGGATPQQMERFVAAAAKPAPTGGFEADLHAGDVAIGEGRAKDAVVAYQHALDAAGPNRAQALELLVGAQQLAGQMESCAQVAVREAPRLERGRSFVEVVLAGLTCANREPTAAWAKQARTVLEPLGKAALGVSESSTDERFQLYEQMIATRQLASDDAGARQWASTWLNLVEAARPRSDDERTAYDVARVRAVTALQKPERVLGALEESARVMPGNFTAWSRLATVYAAVGRFRDAVQSCDRALALHPGPQPRTNLLATKAGALAKGGDRAGALRTYDAALEAAAQIAQPRLREGLRARITQQRKNLQDGPG